MVGAVNWRHVLGVDDLFHNILTSEHSPIGDILDFTWMRIVGPKLK